MRSTFDLFILFVKYHLSRGLRIFSLDLKIHFKFQKTIYYVCPLKKMHSMVQNDIATNFKTFCNWSWVCDVTFDLGIAMVNWFSHQFGNQEVRSTNPAWGEIFHKDFSYLGCVLWTLQWMFLCQLVNDEDEKMPNTA